MESEHQVPIWFFIGAVVGLWADHRRGWNLRLVLSTAGGRAHGAVRTARRHWWGAMMTLLGAFYCFRFNPRRKRNQLNGIEVEASRKRDVG